MKSRTQILARRSWRKYQRYRSGFGIIWKRITTKNWCKPFCGGKPKKSCLKNVLKANFFQKSIPSSQLYPIHGQPGIPSRQTYPSLANRRTTLPLTPATLPPARPCLLLLSGYYVQPSTYHAPPNVRRIFSLFFTWMRAPYTRQYSADRTRGITQENLIRWHAQTPTHACDIIQSA